MTLSFLFDCYIACNNVTHGPTVRYFAEEERTRGNMVTRLIGTKIFAKCHGSVLAKCM